MCETLRSVKTVAVVLNSGGVDSTTLVGLAVDRYGKENVVTVSAKYGQKHSKELECAENINTLLSQEIKTSSVKNIKHITFANKKFKVTQAEDITFGQFTDFQTLISQGYEKIAELLSILLVPAGAKYNDGSYNLKEIVDDIRKLDVSTAYSLINFFLNTLKRRSITTLCSLMWFTIWMKESWKVKKELLKQQMIALYSLYKVLGC